MGSRLRADPERIFECCLEITAPDTNASKDTTIKFVFPPDYSDQEALKQIPGFCYPCISTSDAVQNYTFVLTDIQGQYRFGFCRYSPNVKTCLCIVSYLPWFETFYALLNTVSDLRKKTQEGDVVVSLLEALIKLDPPTPGYDVVVKPNESSKEYRFKTLDTTKLPTIPENHNLTDYYAHVEPFNMILLFVSMFFERRIIVTSKKLSVLTACTYGAMSLLYPMHWQHMFVPIVPPHLLDYCCAPMPFLAGVHSSLMPSVRKMPLDEVVILNADTNEIECPCNDIATLPSGVISTLKSTLKKIDLPIHDRVSRAFLSAMVSLVGGYRDALRFKPGEKIVFDRDVFIESKSQDKREFLQSVLHLQLFEQFVSERLELLNSGKGFNDLFEEQIGLQAEDHKKLKNQYKVWMRGAKKYAKEGIHETKQNLKDFGKEAKMNLKQMKGNLGEMLKGKEEEEIGGEIKKSNSLPYMKHYGIGARISPITRRRALSPQPQTRKAHSFHQDGDRKVRPQRPPPPKKNVRDRTNAMSLVIDVDNGGQKQFTRHSTPNLSVEPPVATLVSLDEVYQTKDTSQDKEKRNTLLDLAEALNDDTISHVVSPKNQEVSTQPTKAPLPDQHPRRSSNPNRPAVPPRPTVRKKSSSSSLQSPGSAVSSPGTPSECLLTPLKPIPIDLQKDIVDSLGPDCQLFFPEWQNRISKINSEITSSTTDETDNAEHSPTLINALTLDTATIRNATKVPESSTTSGLKNAEHSPTLIDGLSLDTTTTNATKFPESSTILHEELSNSLELTDKQKNASSNQTQVSLIDTDSSTSEEFNFNSKTSSQPSHWVNFE